MKVLLVEYSEESIIEIIYRAKSYIRELISDSIDI